jgi:glycogen(starch) synthase
MTADAVGGVWTYALELIRAFRPRGIEVVLAVMGKRPERQQRREIGALRNAILEESDYKLEWMHGCWHDVAQAGDWLLELEQRFKPDVVHLNGYVHGAMPFLSPKIVVGHSCVLSWWEAVKRCDPPQFFGLYRAAVTRGLGAADIVITPTAAMMDALQNIYGFMRRTAVIPNGRTPATMRSGKKEDIVISGGRIWDEGKNITQLIEVANLLKWPLVLAGDLTSPEGEEIRIPRSVHALGGLSPEALNKWLASASIFALPAKYEPFGLLPVEAALTRCALVLGNIPSLREVWGDSAVFVDPDDCEAIADAINRLANENERRDMMAEKARQRALRFSSQRMAEAYLQIYSHLVSERVRVSCAAEVLACA